jgi:hypothetical protein
LHHDYAPIHTALIIQQFLAKNKMVVVYHHPYSPNLAPCDFFCTHGWSRFWNGGVLLTLQRFNENRWLAALDSISVEDFRQCFQQWEHCRYRCIQSQGQYLEGD